jgi:hypothetical protein
LYQGSQPEPFLLFNEGALNHVIAKLTGVMACHFETTGIQ